MVEKGTMCKMARGEMVRFLAERGIEQPEAVREFDRLDYAFDRERSSKDLFVFLRRRAGRE